jgi:phosphatidate cytidylyltransferase
MNTDLALGWLARAPVTAQNAGPVLFDYATKGLLGVILGLLGLAYLAGQLIRRQPESAINPAVVEAFIHRVSGWWMMYAILGASFLIPNGRIPTVVLFGFISFWALREFITLTPTRMGDHRALFWVFFVFTPLQYLLIALGQKWYGLYSILIPVFAVLFIPTRIALTGDYKRFLERAAKIQAGVLVCVYALSCAPSLLDLELTRSDRQPWDGGNAGVLLFLILVVQLGDLAQFAWGRLLGHRVIAPNINSSKTWEGVVGGILTATLLGTALWWITPFRPLEAVCLSLVSAVMGFAGSMTMSAIKRDRGVKDYGTLVEGHAGILDRIDSLCFAAPVFFHLTRRFFTDYYEPFG